MLVAVHTCSWRYCKLSVCCRLLIVMISMVATNPDRLMVHIDGDTSC